MAGATLLISSKNYSSWSLRGHLLVRLAGLAFEEKVVDLDDPVNRKELLMQSSSIRVPALMHDDVVIWDTIAIAEYLNETFPHAAMLPAERGARARCRSISGEMHSGFVSLRQALPMNIKAHFPQFKVWSKAKADIDRIAAIWRECLESDGGPFLFGEISMADAMYAPVVSRFRTYGVALEPTLQAYADRIWDLAPMAEWREAALLEKEEIEELEVEF